MEDRKWKLILEIVLEIIIVSIAFIGSFLAFAYLAHEIAQHDEAAFDERVFDFFASWDADWFISLMKFFTFFGKPEFLIPFYLLLVGYFFVRKRTRYGTSVLIIGVTSTFLLFGLKELFKRDRPDLPLVENITNYSFPSGHALLTFILCSIFIYLLWQGNQKLFWKFFFSFLLLLFAFIVGVSRIILRVHYPTDVLAGFCMGFVWSILSFWLMNKMTEKKSVLSVHN
jgi:membrane-associated phospholipid phosphatase